MGVGGWKIIYNYIVLQYMHGREGSGDCPIPVSMEYRIRVKFGGDKKLTAWRSDLEPPIIMSANYFNLGSGADHSSW